MKRKRQLFSLLLAVCVFFASLQVGTNKVYALSSKIEINDTLSYLTRDGYTVYTIYDYDNWEDVSIFNTEDEIWVEGEGRTLTLKYKGTVIASAGEGQKIYFPEYNGITNWIIDGMATYDNEKNIELKLLPYDSMVPNVYFFAEDGTPVKFKLSDTPDSHGMVKCFAEDGSLYKDLNISVSQYVYPIESNQLKITISSPNSPAVGSYNFKYYKDADKTEAYDSNRSGLHYADEGCNVGRTDEVNIYIDFDESIIQLNASVESGKGSIFPEGLRYLRQYGTGGEHSGYWTYTITPDTGYTLDKLKVNGNEETPTEDGGIYKYKAGPSGEDLTLVASFKKIQYNINTEILENLGGQFYTYDTENGEYVGISNQGYLCEYESDITVYLKPDEGYEIKSFSDSENSGAGISALTENADGYFEYTISNVDRVHNLEVKFGKIIFTVKSSQYSNLAGGEIFYIDDDGNVQTFMGSAYEQYEYGSNSRVYYLKAYDGYELVEFKDTLSNSADSENLLETLSEAEVDGKMYKSYQINDIKSSHNLYISCLKEMFITASVKDNVGGSITGASKKLMYQDEVYTITPDEGYGIKKVTDNGEDVTSQVTNGKYEIKSIQENHTIEVEFAKFVYNVNTSVKDQVGGSILGDTQAEHGDEKVYTITPDIGYELKKVTDNGEDVTSKLVNGEYKITVTQNHTIEAEFAKLVYNVSASVKNEIGGSIAGDTQAEHGDEKVYTVTPNAGYEIKMVTDNGEDVTSKLVNGEYKITVTQNHTIEAEFAKIVYSINASVKNKIGGSITGDVQAEYGDEKVYVIAAEEDYAIVKVTDNGEDVTSKLVNGEYKITVTQNHTIEVEFTKTKFDVSLTVKDQIGGTITGEVKVGQGAVKTYTITPDTGYEIKKVTDNGEDVTSQVANGEYTITVTENHIIEVEFTKATCVINLAVKDQTGGTITGETKVEYGLNAAYTITPDTGYEIKKVTDNGVDVTSKVTDGKYTITATENHTIEVEFAKLVYTVSVSVKDNVGGSITGDNQAEYGAEKTYIIASEADYAISKVTDNGVDVTSQADSGKYTITVTENHIIEVEFTKTAYVVSLVVKDQIGGTITGAEKVGQGAVKTYTITPDTGYEIKKVTDNGADVTSQVVNGEYTITVTENHTIEVEFSKIVFYEITKTASAGGSILGADTIEHGGSQTYTIVPDNGYEISEVYVDGVSCGVITEYTFKNVTENHTIAAEFTEIEEDSDDDNTGDVSDKTDEDVKLTIKVVIDENLSEIPCEKAEDGTIKVDLTDDEIIEKLIENSQDKVLSLDFSSALSSEEPLEIRMSGKWFDKDGTVKGISVKSFTEIYINDSMLSNYKINPKDVITLEIRKGSVIVNMKINGVSVSEVDKKNQIKLDYEHGLGKNTDKNNTVAVEILDNGTEKVLPFAMLKDNDTNKITILTPKFGEFEAILKQSKTFADVDKNWSWAKNNIEFVTAREIFAGTSENTFSPEMTVTRGMFVTVIGRLYGVDKEYKLTFTDVDKNAYYANYVAWASANGIVNGIGNGQFAPNRAITRQEMAVIFANYINFVGYNMKEAEEKILFSDNSDIAAWAAQAVELMQKADILNGVGDNSFAPNNTTTRAEAATAITNFIKSIVNNYSLEADEREVL